ncbi:glycosyltransferase family A protein [Tamlana sp. 2_MG-2023]|uniref:glycosyltransferase family A protein n=1 Tax=unclassified Tamlana TaxID=2614803 RepID=UPI0026E2C2B1|nr:MULTISPECIES: glycosyltransferase family A protein [unclassified Tamlana]MDO6758752.1 glycosyltransferase family A protein [Tamlana sp. 2_MG-2023]MDO6789451.1 glycosyltransferase family A protein [Tamlana sp. 1_MG-2023]
MRIGLNPNKDTSIKSSGYLHQVIIPVYIPNHEGYFKDSFEVFKLCIESLLKTIHGRTFITIVNNGSSQVVQEYLGALFDAKVIQELIHTENIGKLNAILKGLVGNNIELVTISDADVLFLPNWQQETIKVFSKAPKAGVVGLVPQFKMFEAHCGNVIYDNLFNSKLKFLPVKNPKGLEMFYDSIGWKRNYNQDYLKYSLGLELSKGLSVLVGSGHFVATYKKDMFSEITSYLGFKLGGISEAYLDKTPLAKGYWRLTTQDNFAYHMGNTVEDWMVVPYKKEQFDEDINSNFRTNKKSNKIMFFFKNRLFVKFISIPFFYKIFLKWKSLPKEMIDRY